MRTAIVTGEYYKRRETMVNRHIEKLFGGDTCVIYSEDIAEDPFGKALFRLGRHHRSALDIVTEPFHRRSNFRAYRFKKAPYGREKRRLLEFLGDQQVEAVLCEFGHKTVVMAPVIHEIGVPLIGYVRGADATQFLRNADFCEAFRRTIPLVRGVVSVAQFLLDNLAAHGISHPRSYVVPSGVDVAAFSPGQKTSQHCIAVGRLVEKKRPDITVRAFCRAARAHQNAVLEILGDGPLLNACKQIADSEGMSNRVLFRGEQPHEAVREALQRGEIFLQHSATSSSGNAEGMPTSIQEAMACGAVVVSTRHAGIPEAIEDGETGLLVDELDENRFSAVIARCLSEPSAVSGMATNARAKAVACFDNSKLLLKLEGIISELAGPVAQG